MPPPAESLVSIVEDRANPHSAQNGQLPSSGSAFRQFLMAGAERFDGFQ